MPRRSHHERGGVPGCMTQRARLRGWDMVLRFRAAGHMISERGRRAVATIAIASGWMRLVEGLRSSVSHHRCRTRHHSDIRRRRSLMTNRAGLGRDRCVARNTQCWRVDIRCPEFKSIATHGDVCCRVTARTVAIRGADRKVRHIRIG